MSAQPKDQFAALLAEYRRNLHAYVFAIVRDHHLTEDVVQESAVVLARRWESFGEVQNFSALAREVARRTALAALRRDSRQPVTLSEAALDALDIAFSRVAPQDDGPIESLLLCIEKLPRIWRDIVRLRYWQDSSVIDIASVLQRSVNTISVTLNRIRSRLAACIAEQHRISEGPE
jgi:RNA polymerase sigma-70 factor (ECF subfamily)